MNYLRNNDTGATYTFDSAPMPGGMGGGQNALMPDYANPFEVYGKGKGYRVKGDSSRVLMNDGSIVRLGVNAAEEQAAQRQALDMEKARLNNQLLEAQIRQSSQKEMPSMQHVETPNGPMAFNPKTGQYSPIGISAQQFDMGALGGVPGFDGALGGIANAAMKLAVGSAPMQSKEQAQRGQDATAVMELTDQASPLLDKAPGSYLGMAGNFLGRAVGADTDATKAQAQLDVLAGALISKMPKMSGPQSDKDVALYKAMAGNLNDPTLPASAKKAAMTTLRGLNEKYATGYQGGQQGGAAGQAIDQAKQAIASGAPRDAVVRRLEQLGVKNHGL